MPHALYYRWHNWWTYLVAQLLTAITHPLWEYFLTKLPNRKFQPLMELNHPKQGNMEDLKRGQGLEESLSWEPPNWIAGLNLSKICLQKETLITSNNDYSNSENCPSNNTFLIIVLHTDFPLTIKHINWHIVEIYRHSEVRTDVGIRLNI